MRLAIRHLRRTNLPVPDLILEYQLGEFDLILLQVAVLVIDGLVYLLVSAR